VLNGTELKDPGEPDVRTFPHLVNIEVNRVNRKFVAIAVVIVAIISIGTLSFLNARSPTIRVSGAFALYPMMVKWGEEYHKIQPKVTIDISAGGAGKGMTDALAGLVDIGMVSREIYPEEIAQGAFYVKVCRDAVVATVSKDNPVLSDILAEGLTKQTFYNIYIAGNVTTWGQVVSRSNVTDKIQVYTRSDSCGAADTWANYLGKKQEDLLGIGVYGDPGLSDAVKNDPLGIGFNNIGYAYDMQTRAQVEGIRIIPIDINENGRIDPEEDFYSTKDNIVEAIGLGVYPSPPARDLYLVTKDKFTGTTEEFVKWILTDGQNYLEEAGYVTLPSDVIAEQLQKLEG
jgi:phosphate transport system substrate-binding protein